MTNSTAKPVSTFTLIAVLICVGLFFAVAWWTRHPAASDRQVAIEGLAPDQAWRATPDSRKQKLLDLRANEAKHAASYVWIDQSSGAIQLPIERAMELTVQKYGAKK